MQRQDFHNEVWRRFVRMPYGHLLDYTNEQGDVIYPTPEQCEECQPNGLGYWTPIENCAFFTGLYATALIRQYCAAPDPVLQNEIETLIQGLYLLQDVGKCEGFIARGVGTDGKCHYPLSSEDQVMPWILAVYAYYQSPLCTDKDRVKARLLRVLYAIKTSDYSVPTEWEGISNSRWLPTKGWRGVVKLLFSARLLALLSGDAKDLAAFHAFLTKKPADAPYTRLEIVSHGFCHDMLNSYGKQAWICICAHLCLRELIQLDAPNAAVYRQGLYYNGVTALGMIDDMNGFRAGEKFDVDWTPLLSTWENVGRDTKAQIALGYRQAPVWKTEIVPARHAEHIVLGNSAYAAWIAVTSENGAVADLAYKKFLQNCENIPWASLHLPIAYAAESALIYHDFREST